MPEDLQQLLTIVLVAYAGAVAAVDFGTRRIPNGLTVAAAATGLVLSTLSGGFTGLVSALVGLVIALCAFLPLYLKRGLGAGDVKAMAAVGACVGIPGVFIAIGSTLICGAAAAIALLLCAGEFMPTVQRMHANLLLARAGGPVNTIRPAADAIASRRFPYGLAIACGALASSWWSGQLQALFAGGLQ